MAELVLVTKDELQTLIEDSVNSCLKVLSQNKELPDWLTRREVADYLSCSPGTVDNYSRMGLLRKVKINGMPRFKRDEVKAFLESL